MQVKKLIALIAMAAVLTGCQPSAAPAPGTAGTGATAEEAADEVPEADYSKGIDSRGFVEGKETEKLAEPIDLSAISRKSIGAGVTDEQVDAALQDFLEENRTFSADRSLAAAEGDRVEIEYEALCQGKGFEGSSTDGQGFQMVLGQQALGSEMDEGITGMHPGESKKITFTAKSPEEIAGKEAVYDVTLKGIYTAPPLTDETAKRLVPGCSGAEDLKGRIRSNLEHQDLMDRLQTWIYEHAALKEGAEEELSDYISALEDIFRSMDMSMYQAVKEAFPGSYASFEEYIGMDGEAYEKDLRERSVKQAAYDLCLQELFVRLRLEITGRDKLDFIQEKGFTKEDRDYYGSYLMQMLLQEKVMESIAGDI